MPELYCGEFIKLISVSYRKTQMYLNERLKDIGLTSGQTAYIMITCENGKMVQNKFCDILDTSKGTVAKMLAKLEEQGYVIRSENSEDARSIDVYPTEKAKEVYPFIVEIGNDWEKHITEGLTDIEKMIFFQLLEKASKNTSSYFFNNKIE